MLNYHFPMVLTGTSLFLLWSNNFCPVFEAATGNWSSQPEENGSPGRSPRCTTRRCRWWVNWVWKLTSENQWSKVEFTLIIQLSFSLTLLWLKVMVQIMKIGLVTWKLILLKRTIWGHSQRKLGLNEEKRGLNQQSKGFSYKNGEGCKFYQVDMSSVHVSSWKTWCASHLVSGL